MYRRETLLCEPAQFQKNGLHKILSMRPDFIP